VFVKFERVDKNLIETTDTHLSAFLDVAGYPVVKTYKNGNVRFQMFDPTGEGEKLAGQFLIDQAVVHANRYAKRLKDLRGIVAQLNQSNSGNLHVIEPSHR
jgi:hypothetical protein